MDLPKGITLRKLAIGLALIGLLGAAATYAIVLRLDVPAEQVKACGGGWWPEIEIDHRIQGIARAEKDLAAGNYHASAGAVIRMIPHIKDYGAAPGDTIITRSMRVLAISMTRAGGDLTKIKGEIRRELHGSCLGATPDDQKANIEWAVRAFEALQKKAQANDPVLESELAEALALLPEGHARAKELLEKLAAKDLLPTPEGYRALAVLRAEANDEPGRAEALERCKKMAKDSAICTAPKVPATT